MTGPDVLQSAVQGLPYIVGFVSGYVLFRMQEAHRLKTHAEALRGGLTGELQRVEYVLGGMIMQSVFGKDPAPDQVRVVRWVLLQDERWKAEGLSAASRTAEVGQLVKPVKQLSDDELRGFIRNAPSYQQTVGTGILTPILDAVLSAPPPGWTGELLRKLSWLQWQAFLLSTDAERMNEWMRLTFTVAEHDRDAADALMANHRKSVAAFHERLPVMLQGVRDVLADLDR